MIKTNERTAKRDIIPITRPFVNRTFAVSKITILSANRLFKKCAKIGTRILSVLRYKMAMHIAKMNAATMLP